MGHQGEDHSPEPEGSESPQAMNDLARKAREAMDRMNIDSGVYLSWRDLSLQETQKVKEKPSTLINNFLSTIQFWRRAKKEEVTLLNKVSGYVKPHMMVLLLGPPSAGKTTLLETLAGKKDKKAVSGEVLMNGEPITPTFQRLFGYVTQEDVLEPQLTVEETLQFSSTLRNHPDVSEEQRKARVKGTMDILSIAHVKDTNVGGEMLRGVSGGEKKRVSIGVEFVKGPLVFLLDEPTTGLDSTSALQVVRALRALADAGIPVICSLLQPSQELYELFDTVILMQNRSVAYFGPTSRVLSHFEDLGFECPEDKNIAEFLLEICTEEGQEYRGKEGAPPPDLGRDFRDSAANEELGKKLWKSVAPPSGVVTYKPSPYEPYGSSIWTQMKECTKQAAKCLVRNKRIFYSRIFRAVAIGLLLGTLFFRMDPDQSGAENRVSLLFYCITFTAMGAIASIPQIVEERDLYYHHRSLRFYRPFAYFFASICVDIPLSVVETVLFTTIVYWMTGLVATDYGAHFGLFVGILFLTNMLSKQFCRATAASVPSLNLATAIAPALLCIWLVFAGFLLPRNDIPPYWIWMNYIAPFRYTFEALAINEMYDHTFCETIARDCWITEGSQMLKRYALYTDFYWVYIDTAILFVFYVVFCTITFISLSKLHWRAEVVAQKVGQEGKAKEDESTSLIDHGHHSQGLINDSSSAVEQPATLQDAQGAHLAFVNLSYSVPLDPRPLKRLCGHVEHKKLLNSVCGYVEPGQMVALMGASGAGKSTLLDVLAGRKTGGKIDGKILINGMPKDEYFPRMTGYVEQFNVFIPTLTVQETVRYSAAMRLPSDLSKGQRESRVEEAMRMVRIYQLRHHVVGEPDTGLSPQQRKRLSIAVELVSSPSLLFLDEPTSGLDSQAAMEIMQMVRTISSSGVPVICTIHQPSAALFELFDRLLLLCKGGKLCYFGDREQSLEYFSQYGMVCEGRTNPADFVLECSMGVRAGKYAEPDETADEEPIDEESGEFQPYEAWSRSEQSQQLKEYLDNVKEKSTHSREQAPRYDSPYAVGYFRQIKQCLARSFKAKYRQQRSNQSYLLIYFVMGLVLGSLYWQLDYSLSGTRNRVSLMYFVIVFSALGAIASIPNLIQQRAVYYREKPAFLRPLAYWIGCAITEIPIVIIGTGVFGTLLYAMAGLNWTEHGTHFFVFLGAYVTTSLTSTSFAMMIASIAPSTEVANSLVGMSLSIFSLFAGFIIPKNSIPGYWIWIHYISFFKYALEILSINELVGEEFECQTELQIPIPGTNETLGVCPTINGTEFLQTNFDMLQNDWSYWQTLGVDYAILCGFTLFFTFAMYLGIRFINHLKR